MERTDHKKTVNQEWEANYNSRGHASYDKSTTELSGSRREADLIVRGLKALHAQVQLREAAGIATQLEDQFGRDLLGAAPSEDELVTLIQSVEKPNYVSEPETVTQHL